MAARLNTKWRVPSRLVATGHEIHRGFFDMQFELQRHWPSASFDLVMAHSYLPMFEPFTEPTHFDQAEYDFRSGRLSRVKDSIYWRSTGLIGIEPKFCLECTRLDIEKLGYSYWRLSHQVVAYEYCAQHRIPLVGDCPRCGPFSNKDLPNAACPRCGEGIDANATPSANESFIRNRVAVSEVIDDALKRRIAFVPIERRSAIIARGLSQVFAQAGVKEKWPIKEYLVDLFGVGYLKRLGLLPEASLNADFDELYGSIDPYLDPIVNALLIVAAFGSVQAYLAAAKGKVNTSDIR